MGIAYFEIFLTFLNREKLKVFAWFSNDDSNTDTSFMFSFFQVNPTLIVVRG